jgi:hypothetical protein
VASIQTNVVPIDAQGETRFESSTSDHTSLPQKMPAYSVLTVADDAVLRVVSFASSSAGTRLTQDDLYPARRAFSAEHINALRLLKLGIGRTQRALAAASGEEMVGAEVELHKLQALLPELFCCRALGDGFGIVVNALICAFQNLESAITVLQLRTVLKILQQLRDKPFLTAVESDTLVDMLESTHLNPYPAELIEFLSSE